MLQTRALLGNCSGTHAVTPHHAFLCKSLSRNALPLSGRKLALRRVCDSAFYACHAEVERTATWRLDAVKAVVDVFINKDQVLSHIPPVYGPCVMPPERWMGPRQGAYLSATLAESSETSPFRVDMIRTKSLRQMDLLDKIHSSPLEYVAPALSPPNLAVTDSQGAASAASLGGLNGSLQPRSIESISGTTTAYAGASV